MSDEPGPETSEGNDAMEEAAAMQLGSRHFFVLYIAGTGSQSNRAIVNTRKICEQYFQGNYELKIFDICQQPEIAAEMQIIAAPTLVREHPLPLRRFIGDMSRTEKILAGLGVLENPFEDSGNGE